MKVTTHLHLVLRLRIHGTIIPFHHTFSWCSTQLHTGIFTHLFHKESTNDQERMELNGPNVRLVYTDDATSIGENIQRPFEKFVLLPYYSKLELCGGAATVSISKYLPWQAMHFLQCSIHFLKTCKLQEDSGTGGFDLSSSFLHL
jgi:hypothetical protein